MDRDVLSRLRRGLGANLFSQFVSMVVQLVGVPILLHAWGKQLYGEWLILFAVPAYLTITDLGFSKSAGNDMVSRIAKGDKSGGTVVFQSLMAFVLGVSMSVLGLITILIFSLTFEGWTAFKLITPIELKWILWFLSAGVLMELLDGVNHAGYRSTGDYPFHSAFSGATRLAQFLGIWVVAIAGGGPVVAAGVFLSIRTIATILSSIILRNRHPWLRFGLLQAQRAELERLVLPSLGNVAIPLAQNLNVQGMVLVVGGALGPIAVVTFSTLRTLSRLVVQLISAVNHATEPELAAAYGRSDQALMKSLFANSTRASIWLSLPSASFLAIFAAPIIGFWTNGSVTPDSQLFVLLLASAVLSAIWYSALIALKAANQHFRAAAYFVVSSAFALIFAWAFLGATEYLANIGIALLLVDGVMVSYCMGAASRLIGIRPATFLLSAINPLPLLQMLRVRI